LTATLSQVDSLRGQISWIARPGNMYDIEFAADPALPFAHFRTVTATNRETESVFSLESAPLSLMRIRER
jgi:hypothetical protein